MSVENPEKMRIVNQAMLKKEGGEEEIKIEFEQILSVIMKDLEDKIATSKEELSESEVSEIERAKKDFSLLSKLQEQITNLKKQKTKGWQNKAETKENQIKEIVGKEEIEEVKNIIKNREGEVGESTVAEDIEETPGSKDGDISLIKNAERVEINKMLKEFKENKIRLRINKEGESNFVINEFPDGGEGDYVALENVNEKGDIRTISRDVLYNSNPEAVEFRKAVKEEIKDTEDNVIEEIINEEGEREINETEKGFDSVLEELSEHLDKIKEEAEADKKLEMIEGFRLDIKRIKDDLFYNDKVKENLDEDLRNKFNERLGELERELDELSKGKVEKPKEQESAAGEILEEEINKLKEVEGDISEIVTRLKVFDGVEINESNINEAEKILGINDDLLRIENAFMPEYQRIESLKEKMSEEDSDKLFEYYAKVDRFLGEGRTLYSEIARGIKKFQGETEGGAVETEGESETGGKETPKISQEVLERMERVDDQIERVKRGIEEIEAGKGSVEVGREDSAEKEARDTVKDSLDDLRMVDLKLDKARLEIDKVEIQLESEELSDEKRNKLERMKFELEENKRKLLNEQMKVAEIWEQKLKGALLHQEYKIKESEKKISGEKRGFIDRLTFGLLGGKVPEGMETAEQAGAGMPAGGIGTQAAEGKKPEKAFTEAFGGAGAGKEKAQATPKGSWLDRNLFHRREWKIEKKLGEMKEEIDGAEVSNDLLEIAKDCANAKEFKFDKETNNFFREFEDYLGSWSRGENSVPYQREGDFSELAGKLRELENSGKASPESMVMASAFFDEAKRICLGVEPVNETPLPIIEDTTETTPETPASEGVEGGEIIKRIEKVEDFGELTKIIEEAMGKRQVRTTDMVITKMDKFSKPLDYLRSESSLYDIDISGAVCIEPKEKEKIIIKINEKLASIDGNTVSKDEKKLVETLSKRLIELIKAKSETVEEAEERGEIFTGSPTETPASEGVEGGIEFSTFTYLKQRLEEIDKDFKEKINNKEMSEEEEIMFRKKWNTLIELKNLLGGHGYYLSVLFHDFNEIKNFSKDKRKEENEKVVKYLKDNRKLLGDLSEISDETKELDEIKKDIEKALNELDEFRREMLAETLVGEGLEYGGEKAFYTEENKFIEQKKPEIDSWLSTLENKKVRDSLEPLLYFESETRPEVFTEEFRTSFLNSEKGKQVMAKYATDYENLKSNITEAVKLGDAKIISSSLGDLKKGDIIQIPGSNNDIAICVFSGKRRIPDKKEDTFCFHRLEIGKEFLSDVIIEDNGRKFDKIEFVEKVENEQNLEDETPAGEGVEGGDEKKDTQEQDITGDFKDMFKGMAEGMSHGMIQKTEEYDKRIRAAIQGNPLNKGDNAEKLKRKFYNFIEEEWSEDFDIKHFRDNFKLKNKLRGILGDDFDTASLSKLYKIFVGKEKENTIEKEIDRKSFEEMVEEKISFDEIKHLKIGEIGIMIALKSREKNK